MSLLYLWVKQNNFRVLNLFLETDNLIGTVVINGNGDGLTQNMYEASRRTGLVKLEWEKNGIPTVTKRVSGEKYNILSLHFGGISKIFMKGIYKKNTYTLSGYEEWFLWQVRGKLGKVKRKLFPS